MGTEAAIAAALFLGAFVLIVSERVPRTTVALAGAIIMTAAGLGGYDQDQAFHAIDLNVIFLLVGMMIIVNVMSRTGVFQWISVRAAKGVSGHGLGILLALSTVTAVASAFLDNVTTVILVAPVTLILSDALGLRPTPLLISQALASNIGGAATLVGDPPNILIASAAGITFVDFALNMLPISLISFVAGLGVLAWMTRHELQVEQGARQRLMSLDESQMITDPRLLKLSLSVLLLTILGFLLHGVMGLEPATIALGGAALLLVLVREDPHETLRELEWSTILFFVGLFMMVGGLESVGVLEEIAHLAEDVSGGNLTAAALITLWLSGLISGLVDNIPYTAATIPVIMDLKERVGGGNTLWWSLAMGADFGGNLTIIGASANVLIANLSARGGNPISFWEFLRYGLPVTLVTLLASSIYLWLRYLL